MTATVSPACRPTAGVKAVAASASSARTQKMRCCSASSLTRSLTAGSSVAAITYQAPSRSASSKPRSIQRTSPEPTSPSIAGVTSGETRCTSAPAAISVGHPALGHVAAADDEDLAAGEAQPDRVDREVAGLIAGACSPVHCVHRR